MAIQAVTISRRTFVTGFAGTVLAGATGGHPAVHASDATSASLGPLINIPQTYNNCGPAAVAEVLAYWGIFRTQAQTQAVLRVNGPVAGMTPYGVPSYARTLGLSALLGAGGTAGLVKALVANRFPVIVHQVISLDDYTGHWRPVEAYDDAAGVFVTSDPYLGPSYRLSYRVFDTLWAQRDYAFIVLYPPSRQAALASTVNPIWNKAAAYRRDLALVQAHKLDVSPTAAPASTAGAYHALALAWDEAQLGRVAAARADLQQAVRAGANATEVRWVGDAMR